MVIERLAVFGALVFALGCAEPARSLVTDAGPSDATLDGASVCASDFSCDDRIACTIDHCRDGACTHAPCTDCCAQGMECVENFGCGRARTPCTVDSECGDSIRCTLDRCRDGRFCEHAPQESLCASGEICLGALGCVPRPPDRCATDRDCTMTPCLGSWSCQPELGCQFRSLTNCDDGIACTTDTCSDAMGGCRHAPRDSDGDTHGAMMCGGDDCDDANPMRFPGATEVCANHLDDDCDGMVDEDCCRAGQACTTPCGSNGTSTCLSGSMAGPCAPPMETCNGRDDNCDGVTDEGCCATGVSCTSACGSMGQTTCPAPGVPSVCRPPTEACNGRDDDCDGAIDNGFACVPGAVSACMTSCGAVSTRTCNPDCTQGPCRALTEVCNGRDDDCDGVADNGFSCAVGATGSCPTACGSTGRRTCLGSCNWDACVPPAEVCNGVDDNCNATCDEGFTCCARSTRDCTALGFVSGTATCRADCGGWDTAGCNNCGNRVRNPGEMCDGADLGGATCASQGFGGGTLRCNAGCTFDSSGCSACGNGRIDPGEVCDGANLNGATCASLGMGFSGGTLRCSSLCALDTTMCTRPFNPTGTWVVSPGVNLYCAFGSVSLSFGMLTVTDTGSGISVSGGGLNCMMAGPSARASRTINATCTLTGGCNETYTLAATFSDDNRFTGTFTATFTGGGCFDCRTRSFAVTATR